MRPYRVAIRFSPSELEALDAKRGTLSRSGYIRLLIEKCEIKAA